MPLQDGDVFAEYTILRKLGAGGMGEVYLAQHPRLPRRDALKILPANLTDDNEFRQRFSREADLAAGLSHPNIVAIHDRGEFQGQLWISMDYVEGTDAAQELRSQYPTGMPEAEVLEIVTAVADALDYAHSRGLLHRDVKPANILLGEPDPRRRRIFLADFGIARQLGDISGLTATNMMVGTTAYSAPEQLRGSDLDGRTDQYALGCTAFHLLTGSAPFTHSNPAVVITQHLSEPAPQIGKRRPELADLNTALAKALAKDRDDRYPSCSDFAAALSDQANGGSTDTSATVLAATRPAPVTALAETTSPETTTAEPTVLAKASPAETPPETAALAKPSGHRIRPAALIATAAAIVLVAVAVLVGQQLLRNHPHQSGNGATSTSAPRPSGGAPSAPGESIQLSPYITDQSGVLIPAGRVTVQRAIDKLYGERNVHLWVAYVNNFAGLRPLKWAENTMRANGLGDMDALLAVATDDRTYSFRVGAAVPNVTPVEVENIRRTRIEPAVSQGEWARAGIAAANGLEALPG